MKMSIFKSVSNLPVPHDKYGMFYIEKDMRDSAYKGDLSRIKDLMREYPDLDLNAVDEYGRTPLYMACDGNQEGVLDYLLNQPKVDVNIQTILGNSPLLMATWNDNSRIAGKLVDAGADLHAKTLASREYHGGVTAHDVAVERDNKSLAEFLRSAMDDAPSLAN